MPTPIEKKGDILTMRPKDYIVFAGGLKIENISDDYVITVELPCNYKIEPFEISCKHQ